MPQTNLKILMTQFREAYGDMYTPGPPAALITDALAQDGETFTKGFVASLLCRNINAFIEQMYQSMSARGQAGREFLAREIPEHVNRVVIEETDIVRVDQYRADVKVPDDFGWLLTVKYAWRVATGVGEFGRYILCDTDSRSRAGDVVQAGTNTERSAEPYAVVEGDRIVIINGSRIGGYDTLNNLYAPGEIQAEVRYIARQIELTPGSTSNKPDAGDILLNRFWSQVLQLAKAEADMFQGGRR